MATTRSGPAKRTPASRTAARSRQAAGPAWSPLAKVPTKYHTPIFIGLIALSLLVFFGGVIFGGKFFATNDNISWLNFVPYLEMMDSKGEHPFWIPYIFSGMPAYASYLVTGDRWWDISMKIMNIAELAVGMNNFYTLRIIFHYFILGLGMYLLMRSKKAARSTSLFVSLATIFSTWIIVYIMIGHNTKVSVLMTFPFLFLCLDKLIHRWSLLYAGLVILVIHVMIESAHPQTAFYGLCAVGVYLLFELVGGLFEKRRDIALGAVRAGLILLVAGGFAYGMGMDRFIALQEYTPYSTREAHGYKYATDWSFSPEEMITFVVPSFFGFGKQDYAPPGGEPQEVMTYWGQMPFTDAAHYMGIAVLILGLFGAWMNRKNRFVQAMLAVGIFGLVLSFGRNLPILFDFFYNVVPRFNQFRAPSQALVLLEFVFPILAGFGIESLIAMHKSGDNPRADKSILYGTYAFAGMIIIGLLATNAMQSDYYSAIAAAATEKQQPVLTQLQEFIFSNMQTDWLLAGFFGIATLLIMYFYAKGTISPFAFKLALFAILIFDLWRVGMRPMNAVPMDEAFAVFNATDVDAFLHQDTTKYRILDLTAPGPNFPARHLHEHIMGYHAAKMRNYQDLLDTAGNSQVPTSPLAWNMLNTKYIISPQPVGENMTPVFQSREKQAVVFRNDNYLPRAWFVNRVEQAGAEEVLLKIKNSAFDPRDVAYIAKPLSAKIDPVGYAPAAPTQAPADTARAGDTTAARDTVAPAPPANSGNGTVRVARYEPNGFTLDVDAPGNNFLVISEIYYPASWHATIDGKETEIIQTNYLLRGVVVPPGKHTVEMRYVIDGFDTAKNISLGLNLVMFGLIGAGYMMYRRRPEEADPVHDAPVIEADDV